MFRSLSIILSTGLLVLNSHTTWAKSKIRVNSANPRDIVSQYLSADFSGSRIFNENKAATTQLVTWSEEPPWDQIIIVGHYSIQKVKVKRKVGKVGVRFSNLGELKGDTFYPEPQTEDATFETKRVGSAWRVDRPILVPHISVASAERYLREQIKQLDANSERAKALEKTIQDLRSASKN